MFLDVFFSSEPQTSIALLPLQVPHVILAYVENPIFLEHLRLASGGELLSS